VVEVLAIPEPMIEDDIAIDELLTRRQRRAAISNEEVESSTEKSKEGDTQRVRQLVTPDPSVVSGAIEGG
jgi:hypothetical protein